MTKFLNYSSLTSAANVLEEKPRLEHVAEVLADITINDYGHTEDCNAQFEYSVENDEIVVFNIDTTADLCNHKVYESVTDKIKEIILENESDYSAQTGHDLKISFTWI